MKKQHKKNNLQANVLTNKRQAKAKQGRFVQIGRASCRERVFQRV